MNCDIFRQFGFFELPVSSADTGIMIMYRLYYIVFNNRNTRLFVILYSIRYLSPPHENFVIFRSVGRVLFFFFFFFLFCSTSSVYIETLTPFIGLNDITQTPHSPPPPSISLFTRPRLTTPLRTPNHRTPKPTRKKHNTHIHTNKLRSRK